MTLKQLCEVSHVEPRLIRAVVKQFGGWNSFKESASDIVNYGAQGGFIYYTETADFAKRNRRAIAALVEQLADELGETPVSLVQSFNCLRDEKPTASEVACCLCGIEDDTQILNALAWLALEEVARSYTE